MTVELREVGVDELASRLADLEPLSSPAIESSPHHVGRLRRALRELAALRGSFVLDDLLVGVQHLGRRVSVDPDVRDFATDDCERVETPQGGRWRLRLEVRQATIRHLASIDPQWIQLRQTVRDVPLERYDVAGRMAEAYLQPVTPALRNLDIDRLAGALTAREWFEGVAVAMPSTDDIRRQLSVVTLLAPLRRVSDQTVVGRQSELGRISAYVHGPPAAGFRPLVIHGPGGIGKSALIARFILDQSSRASNAGLPFAYLTFDRSDLLPDQPLGLLAEALRQLGQQATLDDRKLRVVLQGLDDAQRQRTARSKEGTRSRRSSAFEDRLAGRDLDQSVRSFANMLNSVTARPVLIVLDTFERAQRHGWEVVDRLWRVLSMATLEAKQLRVVILGRGDIEGISVDSLALAGLPLDVCVAYLQERAGNAEVDSGFLKQVARLVDGNPLTLRLAADLLIGHPGNFHSEDQQQRLLLDLRQTAVQGVLYRRVLDHIDNPTLRRLAVPGLALRRITVGAIREVLAPSCGLGRIPQSAAWDLYEALESETSLIVNEGSALVHRPDVRREVLPLLAEQDPDRVASLHRRAVRYYASRESPADRTEELYHRLVLDQSPRTLDRHWDEVAGATLDGAIEELPDRARAYLATKLDLALDGATVVRARDEDWAAQAVRIARVLLDDNAFEDALVRLDERPSAAGDTEVAALRVEALARLGRFDDALTTAEGGRARAAARGDTREFIRFTMLAAQLLEDAHDFDPALSLLTEARDRARAIGDSMREAAAGVSILRVHRRLDESDLPQVRAQRAEVIALVRRMSLHKLRAQPSLVRDLAAEVGTDLPHLVVEASTLVGIDVASEQARAALSGAGWAGAAALADGIVRARLEDDGPRYSLAPADDGDEDYPETAGPTSQSQGRIIREYLDENDGDELAVEAVSEYFKFEADQATFVDDERD